MPKGNKLQAIILYFCTMKESSIQNNKTNYGYKSLLALAFPIMLGNLAQTLITLTDTAFLGRVSENALSASLMTGIMYYVFVTLAWGFSIGIQVMIARRLGENKLQRIGVIFQHGCIILLPLAISLFSILHFWSTPLLRSVIQSDNIFLLADEYMSFRYIGILFVCFNFLFRGLYIGLSNTKPITYTTIIMALVNIFLDYSLIFGKFGFPEMGVAGAAIASVCAEISALIFFFFYTLFRLPIKTYTLFSLNKIEGWLLKTIMKLSLPTMIQKLLSIGVWFLFFIMVEHMGERPIAVTGVIRSVYMLVSIPAFALGAGANSLTSRLIGEGRGDEVKNMLRNSLKLSLLCLAPIVLLCLIYPSSLLSIYTEDASLINDSYGALYALCLGTISLSIGQIYFESISGRGETFNAMLLESVVLIAYVSYIWFLSTYLKLSIGWVWTSELLYWSLLGIFSVIYLHTRKSVEGKQF